MKMDTADREFEEDEDDMLLPDLDTQKVEGSSTERVEYSSAHLNTGMENEPFQGPKKLKHTITAGMEQVKQLRATCSGNQERVLKSMLASYEEALLILNEIASGAPGSPVISAQPNMPHSLSPDDIQHKHKESSGSFHPGNRGAYKRQTSIQHGEHKRVSAVDDGYIWRKYGQKVILGSKYPRCYYKCAHRGCLARKKVQRTDDDDSVFDVVYRGQHTCQGRQMGSSQMGSS